MEPRSRSFPSRFSTLTRAFCLILWSILTQFALAQTPLTVRVAQELAVPGGYAQIKIYADNPALISRATLALDLDPSVFGPVERVGAYSATGDVAGFAVTTGTHVDLTLVSPSGGIGQLPDIPVATIRAPILPSAPSHGFISLSLPGTPAMIPGPLYPADAWTDRDGKPYAVTLLSGQVVVGGIASIWDVTPGGGFQAAGTVLRIDGSGFTDATTITAAGLAFSSFRVLSSSLIEATLANSAELTGTRFRLTVPNNNPIDYFAVPPSAVSPADPALDALRPNSHVIVPLTEQQASSFSQPTPRIRTLLLQNPSTTPAEIRVREVTFGALGPAGSRRFTIAPGETISLPRPVSLSQFLVDSETPLRMLQYVELFGGVRSGPDLWQAPSWDLVAPSIPFIASTSEVNQWYQVGTPPLEPQTVGFNNGTGTPTDATIQVNAGPWLQVTPTSTPGRFNLAFNTSGLSPGTYTGTITGTLIVPDALRDFPAPPARTIQVTLTVHTEPKFYVEPIWPASPPDTTSYGPVSFTVKSFGTQGSFTLRTSTESGGNWLSVDKTSGMTPAEIQVHVDHTGLAGGRYAGTIFVDGPFETIQLPVSLSVYPMGGVSMTLDPSLSVTREVGTDNPTQTFPLSLQNKTGPVTLAISTNDGGNWLSATVFDQVRNAVVMVRINSASLPPGTYTGKIVATAGEQSAETLVTLTILANPQAPPIVSPQSLRFTTPVGIQSEPQTVTVQSQQPVAITFSATAPVTVPVATVNPLIAPRTFELRAYSTTPGSYNGEVIISNSFGSTRIPVAVDITGAPDKAPVLSSVVNAASHRAGPIAPGEMLTLRGIAVGPQRTGLTLDPQGNIQSSIGSGTFVEINGHPAPILYASPEQWNVVVPYEVDAQPSAEVRVLTFGVPSKTWTLPVRPASPGIFTTSSSGTGQGAVLNQDNTLNGPANPAPTGTIIQIYATGGGQTNPPSLTGSVNSSAGANRSPVKVFFAGTEAPVVYAGPAPGFASGALQVNAVVPPIGVPGTTKAVQLQLEIDGLRSAPVEVTVR